MPHSPFRHELPARKHHPKGNTMYIGLGTILVIILLFLVFRALSGRRA